MNPKILFGVSLVIGLSIIIGVVLAVGILLWNNLLTITPAPTKSTIPIEQQVTIATDKTEYKGEEAVKITIKNNLEKNILSSCCPRIEKFEDSKWKTITNVAFVRGVSSFAILPKEGYSTNWNQRYLKEGASRTSKVSGGKYRISIEIGLKDCKQTIYSNEFTIKEKRNISCSNNFDCPSQMKCKNNICVNVGCIREGHRTPITAISPEGFEQRKHIATECCEGLKAILPPDKFDEDCNFKPRIGVSGGDVCANCGNGVCESWENKCNCSEDCK